MKNGQSAVFFQRVNILILRNIRICRLNSQTLLIRDCDASIDTLSHPNA